MQKKILYAVLLSLTAVTTVLATAFHAGKNGKPCCHQWNHYQQSEKEQNTAGNNSDNDPMADYPFIPILIQ
jgi:peptidoglycan hydrolase CwlO-like protein